MTTTAEQQIDLTGEGDSLRYVEVLTDAGIVRVNVNFVDTRTGQRVVVVEVEPNTTYKARTQAGGDWIAETRDHFGGRIDVTLTKDG